jgi:hypothetical protein
MVRDAAMLTLQIVEWDTLAKAIKEGTVLSDIWEGSRYNA